MDVAEAGGYINKPKIGWYEAVNPATGEILSTKLMRAKEIADNKEFWLMMFEKTDFADHIKNKYTMATTSMMSDEDTDSMEIVVND